MGIHITKYETKNGKTRKVKTPPKDLATENGAAGQTPGAGTQSAGNSGKKGA